MEDVVMKRSHKKKKKRSRHSSVSSEDSGASSDAGSGGEVARKRAREEHRKKREKGHKGEERSKDKQRSEHTHDKHKNDRPEHRKRDASPERRKRDTSPAAADRGRHPKEERDREAPPPSRNRGDRGSRWEDEEQRYNSSTGRKIKQEPVSDNDHRPPQRRGPRDQDHQSEPPRRNHRDQDDQRNQRDQDDQSDQRRGNFENRRGRGGFRGGRGGGRGRGRGGRGGGGGGEEEFQWGRTEDQPAQPTGPPVEKEKPNFGLSGKLTEDSNTINGIVIKYSEPPESRKPKRRWRLYVFKGQETLPTLYIHRQSAYLMGRDRKIADIPLDHPSVSKQHAALQYRLVTFKRPNGGNGKCIRPYIIDLESANGTYVNNKKIEARKYVEIMEKDVIKFGYSSREYVLLHEHSQDTSSGDDDDDVKEEPPAAVDP